MTNEADLDTLLDRVKTFLDEHCERWAFIATVDHDEKDGGGSTTISTWNAPFNEAVGMAERLKERMRQRMIETDYPTEPPDEEKWKETNA